jgi:anti-anti-sigma factor
MKTKLSYERSSRDDSTLVYTLHGSLYGSKEGYSFQEDVRQASAVGARRFVVDLAGVDKIDSSGIGILVTVLFSTSQAGGAMVLAALSPLVEKVLGIVMLLDRVSRAGTVDEAIAKLDSMKS